MSDANGDAKRATLITKSFRGDFDACKILCESVDRFVPETILHQLIVPENDVALFSVLASSRRQIISESGGLLPRWFVKLPLPPPRWRALLRLPRRDIYATPFSRPVRGWIAQQIMKIAAAHAAPTEIVLFCDSDSAFVRPFHLEHVLHGDKARLYQHPDPVERQSHKLWHLAACELLNLPPDEYHGGDYIDALVLWRRSAVRKLTERLEAISGRDWRVTLARRQHFSEYILYGVFVECALGVDAAGHVAEASSLCHTRWTEEFSGEADQAAFVRALEPQHLMCLVQSTLSLSLPERRALNERLVDFAASQDAAAGA